MDSVFCSPLNKLPLRTLFETGNMGGGGDAPLLMELGASYCLLSQWNSEGAQPYFVRLWSFAPQALEDSLEKVAQAMTSAAITPKQTIVGVAFPEVIMVPEALEVDGSSLLQSLYATDAKATLISDKEPAAYFALPEAIQSWLQKRFSPVRFVPAGVCALSQQSDEGSNSIEVFFIESTFRVAVYKAGSLQLAQQYEYTAPLDVVYYLLKICSEFSLSQQDTSLNISGFVASDSALYNELYQYFLQINFNDESIEIDGHEVPKYYFRSLYNLAACAL